MEHKHLDAAALEGLLAVDRTVEQNEQLFYLMAMCPVCREAGGWLLELHQAHALPPVFGLIDAVLARSRAEAPQLLCELAALDPEDRLARLHADPRFVSWGLCELLIRESRQAAPDHPSEALHLADLAVHVADLIPEGEPFEEKWIYQLRSLSWAGLANAYKVQGDLAIAERTFEMSGAWWEAGAAGIGDALGYESTTSLRWAAIPKPPISCRPSGISQPPTAAPWTFSACGGSKAASRPALAIMPRPACSSPRSGRLSSTMATRTKPPSPLWTS